MKDVSEPYEDEESESDSKSDTNSDSDTASESKFQPVEDRVNDRLIIRLAEVPGTLPPNVDTIPKLEPLSTSSVGPSRISKIDFEIPQPEKCPEIVLSREQQS
ncbi:uncharacterized protein LOC111248962 isoform X2 [Varroa destructor]|uniref:Uncharacterized protein n=1 Tax=Varroa destructor TaxID=109461 RepID=A0A7M7K5D7_VARDE|nr:uncharacterized protein LOC111248962 isoform X2 [Varroa destructor]